MCLVTVTARILAQGDEITTGATPDTNTAWLARELTSRGARVVGFGAAPDDVAALAAMIRAAAADCALLVSTGGLGPTDDDLTASAAALAADVECVEDAEARAQVEARFAALGRPMPAVNLRQARMPAGATVLANPVGTAPGFCRGIGAATAFFFPGVPRELEVMAAQHLFPWLATQGLTVEGRRRLHVCGVGESALQERLAPVRIPEGVRVGWKAWLPYVTVVLYGADPRALEAAAAIVRARLGPDCFGEDEVTFPRAVGASLAARAHTLGLAESCRGGGAGALVTEASGSSAWFRGGVVSYDDAVKREVLGVSAAVLAEHGAVSEPCAAAMASGARRCTGADVGLSITGIAGPDGGTPEKPVGTVCLGLDLAGDVAARTVQFGDRGRDIVRTLAAATALDWLRRRLTRD